MRPITDEALSEVDWIRRFAVRSPTLPPATHTNVYVVGSGQLAVIDPASPYPDEQAALDGFLDRLADGGERVVEILLTHHHVDHVSGANHLRERLGVPVAAHPLTQSLCLGAAVVDRAIDEGALLRYGGVALEPLRSPGHAPGHLVFFEPRARAVIVGDMVASQGTIVIDPPEGDMRLYLESLERLQRLEARWLLPAHGPPVDDPRRLLDFYIAHRLEREAKVLAALAATGGGRPAELVPHAYAELEPRLYPLAERSLLAHLLKLRAEGRAAERDGRWHAP